MIQAHGFDNSGHQQHLQGNYSFVVHETPVIME
jgi:hypothetical protein